MSKTFSQLYLACDGITNEQNIGGNTKEEVGGLFHDIVEKVEEVDNFEAGRQEAFEASQQEREQEFETTMSLYSELPQKVSELEEKINGGGSEDIVIVPETAKDIVGNETSTINIIANTSVDVKSGNTITIDVDGCPEITKRWYFYNNGTATAFYNNSAEIELTEDLTSVRIAITSPSSALTGVSGTVTAKIYIKGKEGGEGLSQKVQKNVEDIAEAKASIDSLSDDVEGVKDAVGDVKEKSVSKEIKDELAIDGGGIIGNRVSIGGLVSAGFITTGTYARTQVNAMKGRTYKIVTYTKGASTSNYSDFIFLADLEGKCIAKYGNYTGVETDVEATITPTEDSLIFVCIKPAQTAYPEKSISVIETYTEKYPFQEQIDDINEKIDGKGGSETNRNADVALLFQQTNRRYIEDYLTDKYWNGERTSGYDNLKSRLDSHKANGHVVFALCSDTHEGGEYNTRSSARSADRAITVYSKLASYCDAAIHCGDISTDYGTAKSKLLAFSRGVIEKFTHNKPFLIVKGNHDNNENGYSEVDFSDIDFSKNTYYHQYQSGKFEEVSEADWRGEQLLIADEDFVTDKEFKNNVQKYKCPTSAVWGNGAYYYYDIADKNLRVIVLNIYAVNDEGVRKLGEEYKWLAEVALNVPSDYSVVTLAHTALTNNTYLKGIINAFKNGTRTSDSVDDVSWDKTFSGSGKYVGNLHGHEHGYKYESASGFNDIGFTWSNCVAVTTSTTDDERGDASKYGISVVAIDVTNRKIYDEQISGVTREYSY